MKRKSLRQVFHEHPELFRDLERRDRGGGSRAPTLEGWSGLLDRVAARIERTCHRRNRPLPRIVKLRRVEGRLFIHFAETAPAELTALVRKAEEDSTRICARCGARGCLREDRAGRWRTRCDRCHAAEREEQRSDPAQDAGEEAAVRSPPPGPAMRVLREQPLESANREERIHLERMAILARPLPLATLDAARLERLVRALGREFPWMHAVTARVAREQRLRLWNGNAVIGFQPMLLVAPPGVGKTRYARRLAERLGLPFLPLAVGGSNDGKVLTGTARGWGSGQPSPLLQQIARQRIANPFVLLDEIDKESPSRHNGRMSDTLHQLLEPANAARWYDEFLHATCDLSRLCWVATANGTATLERSLLSRFEVIEVAAPAGDDLLAVVHGARVDVASRLGVPAEQLPLPDEAEWAWLRGRCHGRRPPSPRLVARLVEALLARRLETPAACEPVH